MNTKATIRQICRAIPQALFGLIAAVVIDGFFFLALAVCWYLRVLPLFFSVVGLLEVVGLLLRKRNRGAGARPLAHHRRLPALALVPLRDELPAEVARHEPARRRVAGAVVLATIVVAAVVLPLVIGRRAVEKPAVADYARELPAALATGERFESLIRSTDGIKPLSRFRIIYSVISASWHYQPDIGGDHFSNVEHTLRNGFTGDCEDQAALIVAAARALRLTAVVVLGETHDGRGHAWAEALVSQSAELSPDMREAIASEFGDSAYLIERDHRWWLVCSPARSLDRYEPRWWIDLSGQLHSFSKTRP